MKLHLDPRTKLFLILLCVLSAVFAPNLYFQFALVTLISLLAAFSGKWQYALRGILAYALICAFTVWCMGVLAGTCGPRYLGDRKSTRLNSSHEH